MNSTFNEILQLVDSYVNWFKNEIKVKKLKNSEHNVIHTPFLDVNNDNISIYATLNGDVITLSDDSNTLNVLEMMGLSLTEKRKEQIQYILKKYGMELNENNEIIKVTNKSSFPKDLHLIISTIIDIGNLYLTTQERVTSYFYDDVIDYLTKKNIYFTEDVEFKGKSNFTHTYDLLFQKNKQNPERLCNVIDNPNKGKISNVLFSWEDTRDIRKTKNPNSKLIIVLNDKQKLSQNILDALEKYDVSPVLWSEREKKYQIFM